MGRILPCDTSNKTSLLGHLNLGSYDNKIYRLYIYNRWLVQIVVPHLRGEGEGL